MTQPLATADRERLVAELREFDGERRVAVEDGVVRERPCRPTGREREAGRFGRRIPVRAYF